MLEPGAVPVPVAAAAEVEDFRRGKVPVVVVDVVGAAELVGVVAFRFPSTSV